MTDLLAEGPVPTHSVAADLHRIAAEHAGGLREGFSREEALRELAATSTDPDLLSEAAAAHAIGANWFAVLAVELLMAAGADPELMDEHAQRLWEG